MMALWVDPPRSMRVVQWDNTTFGEFVAAHRSEIALLLLEGYEVLNDKISQATTIYMAALNRKRSQDASQQSQAESSGQREAANAGPADQVMVPVCTKLQPCDDHLPKPDNATQTFSSQSNQAKAS